VFNMVKNTAGHLGQLEIFTLGRFQIVRQGKAYTSNGKAQTRPLELLKLIVALDGKIRSTLASDTLWPETDGAKAANVLKITLNRLRKIIGKETIQQSAGWLTMDRTKCWVDKWEVVNH